MIASKLKRNYPWSIRFCEWSSGESMVQADAEGDLHGAASGRAPRISRASLIAFAIVATCLSQLVGRNIAYADCASGDGNVTSPGLCTTPQNLTGPTGTIVSGATLSTGPTTTAYTVSSTAATVTNSGTATAQGSQVFLINGGGGTQRSTITLNNSGTITAVPGGNAVTVSSLGPAGLGSSFTFTNTGNVTGPIFMTPDPALGPGSATITQAGGVIQGNIFITGFNTVVNVTGGVINGSI